LLFIADLEAAEHERMAHPVFQTDMQADPDLLDGNALFLIAHGASRADDACLSAGRAGT
jgi:hypothetical protein